jgi:hypothetical protein
LGTLEEQYKNKFEVERKKGLSLLRSKAKCSVQVILSIEVKDVDFWLFAYLYAPFCPLSVEIYLKLL